MQVARFFSVPLIIGVLGALPAHAQSPTKCEYPVYLQSAAILPKDLTAFDKAILHERSFCRVNRVEDANFVFVLTRTNLTSASTIPIPHTATSRSTVTGYGSQAGDFSATVNTATTVYELHNVPTSCEQVHLYVYRRNDPLLVFHSSYIDMPLGKALLVGLALGLMATSGPAPTPSACDYGRSRPAKDVTNDAMKAVRSGVIAPRALPQQTKQPEPSLTTGPPVGELYLGSWRSSSFNAAGQVGMRLSIEGSEVRVHAVLTGSQISKISLTGTATRDGERWTINLNNAQAGLSATAVIQGDEVVGTYDFTAAGDRGSWSAKMQEMLTSQ